MDNNALLNTAIADFSVEHSVDELGPEWWPPVWALLDDETPAVPRILVAEPRPELRLQIGHALREAGMDADFATNSEEACTMARHQRYDVAVVNPDMERAGETALCESLSRSGGRGATPIITLSDRQPTSDAAIAFSARAHTNLLRPLSSECFVDTVVRMARSS